MIKCYLLNIFSLAAFNRHHFPKALDHIRLNVTEWASSWPRMAAEIANYQQVSKVMLVKSAGRCHGSEKKVPLMKIRNIYSNPSKV